LGGASVAVLSNAFSNEQRVDAWSHFALMVGVGAMGRAAGLSKREQRMRYTEGVSQAQRRLNLRYVTELL
jgi:hypothetical protein